MQINQTPSICQQVADQLEGYTGKTTDRRPSHQILTRRVSVLARRLLLAGALLLVLLVAVKSWADLHLYEQDADWVEHNREVLHTTDQLLGNLRDAETGQRGYLLTGQERYLEPYESALEALPGFQRTLWQLTANDPRQQKRLADLDRLIDGKLSELALTIRLRRSEGLEAALAVVRTDRGKQIMDEIRRVIRSVTDEEYHLLQMRQQQVRQQAQATNKLILSAVLLLLLASGVAAFLIERDLLHRESLEHFLRTSERRLALALEAGRSGAFDWDTKTNVYLWSEELLRLYGFAPERTVRTSGDWIACFHPDDRAAGLAAIEQAFKTGEFDFEFRIRRRDNGEIRWMHGRAQVCFDDAGKPSRMIGTNVDITERKVAEESLARQAEWLREANQDLEQFAYAVSHDLQEPLRTINSYTQLLTRRYGGRFDERAHQFMRLIVEGASRMQAQITGLLSYSQAVESSSTSPTVPLSLESSFREALQNLQASITESAAVITHDPLPTAAGAPSGMVQVFQNLISNALKYRKPKEAPRVHVSAERRNGEWVLSVRDHGIGFDSHQAQRIFGVFQRLHKNEYEGTGVGLAICKRVMERAGGRIWAEGSPGQGAVFYFALPIRPGQ